MKEQLITEGKEATAYVENAGRAANVEVESVILEGNPADEIVDFAEKNDIDLIVMGTQGKTAIQRFLIGSVAENVVRHSKKTVLVVRGETVEKCKSKLRWRTPLQAMGFVRATAPNLNFSPTLRYFLSKQNVNKYQQKQHQ